MELLWKETVVILEEAAPYLLLGFFFAGVLNVLLGRYHRITSALTGSGNRPVFLAALLGVPLPLCSCSVIPTAMTLRRQGANKGTVTSFLISVPETDVVSISLTYALLGPVMTIARPVAALFSAIVAGIAVNRWAGGEKTASDPPSYAENRSGRAATQPDGGEAGVTHTGSSPVPLDGWLKRALRFGFIEMFDDIIIQILVGIVVAGAAVGWLPGLEVVSKWGHTPWIYMLMLVLGIPVYVCASASTPLALGLVAGGVPPGAALVFLLAGPATNIASLTVLAKQLGGRALALYLVSVAFASVGCGVLLDLAFPPDKFSTARGAVLAPQSGPARVIHIAAAFVLIALAAWSLRRTHRLSRWYAAIRERVTKRRP
jgi:uncharacterized membrane protein YraQ (UPF0718 family)